MKYPVNYYKILGYSLIPIDIILIALLELDYFQLLPAYWNSLLVFYILLIINTAFFALRLKHIPEEEREHDYTVFISKYFFLLGLVVLAVNQFLKLQLVISYMPYIISIVIALGFLAFFASRERVEKDIEDEKTKEEEAEIKRKEEFDEKFKTIAKLNLNYGFDSALEENSLARFFLASILCPFVFLIRLLYKLIKWMYKEGWWYVVILGIILIIASLNIFTNLGKDNFYHDEQFHIAVIKSLYEDQGFRVWDFINNRAGAVYGSAYITNSLAYISSKILGYSEFSLRFFVAIFGVLNIFLVYLIFKRIIGKTLAILTSMFFSFNIITLYLARFLRPYSIFLFFYLLTFLFIILLMNNASDHKNQKRKLFYFMLLFISVILAMEEREIAKILLIILPICLIVALIILRREIFQKIMSKKYHFLIITFICFLCVILLDYFGIVKLSIIPAQVSQYLSLNPKISPYYFNLFKAQVKNGIFAGIMVFTGVALLAKSWIYNKRDKLNNFFFLAFLLIPLATMLYLFHGSEDFRYIYHITPFIYGSALVGLSMFLRIFFKNYKKWIMSLILVFFAFLFLFYLVLPFLSETNNLTIKSPSQWIGSDGQKYLHGRAVAPEYSKVFTYIENKIKPGDILIISDGSWNLRRYDSEVTYYSIDTWTYARNITNINESIDFFSFINRTNSQKKIYYIGAYVHMIDPAVIDYLLNNCDNLAKDLGVKQFDYNSFYKGRFYWPNLYVCNGIN